MKIGTQEIIHDLNFSGGAAGEDQSKDGVGMKKQPPEQFRLTADGCQRLRINPRMGSDETFGFNGVFMVRHVNQILRCVVSDGEGWEHVSVSLNTRCPTWDEMCFVKGVFWDDDECVVQFHPPKADYVNNHAFCLHMWKPTGVSFPTPPSIMVGLRGVTLRI